MATITATRQGKFQVQIRLKGISHVIRSFDRKEDATKWGEITEARLKRERAFGPVSSILAPTAKCTVTLGSLIERYLQEVTANRRTERAVQNETYELKAFLKEPICGRLLTELTTEDFNCYVLKRMVTCQKRTIKRQLSVIRTALEIGHKRWNLPSRPELITELGFKGNTQGRQRRLAEGEYDRLMQACDGIGFCKKKRESAKLTPRIMRLILQVALLTAMRRGELLGMKWVNVRFTENYIHIPKSKTNAKRDIPLLPEAAKLLAAFHPERISDELVFPFHFEGLKTCWQRLVKRANIEDLTFHDFRHEALSRLSEAGCTTPELMMFSGHTNLQTLSIYTHGSRKNILNKFENNKSLLT